MNEVALIFEGDFIENNFRLKETFTSFPLISYEQRNDLCLSVWRLKNIQDIFINYILFKEFKNDIPLSKFCVQKDFQICDCSTIESM